MLLDASLNTSFSSREIVFLKPDDHCPGAQTSEHTNALPSSECYSIVSDGIKRGASSAEIISAVTSQIIGNRPVIKGAPPSFSAARYLQADDRAQAPASVQALLTLLWERPGDVHEISCLLFKAWQALDTSDRMEFVKGACFGTDDEIQKKQAGRVIAVLLGWSRDLKELSAIIKGCGIHELRELKNPEIEDCIGLAVISGKLRKMQLPKLLSDDAPGPAVDRTLKKLEKFLEQTCRYCSSESRFRHTAHAAKMARTGRWNLKYLLNDIQPVKGTAARRALANSMIRKLRLEYRYGLNLTVKREDDVPVTAWFHSALKDVSHVLRLLPEGWLMLNPQMREIKLFKKLADGWGNRWRSGKIGLSEEAIDNDEAQAAFGGVASLRVTLAHELGHSFQLGEKKSIPRLTPVNSKKFGNPMVCFPDFMSLSGWKVVDRNSYRLLENWLAVSIGDRHFALTKPEETPLGPCVLSYDQYSKCLWMRDVFAKFSLREYGRFNPKEDFAECFAEYLLLPERLIEYAPLKFLHIEQLCCRYKDNARMLGRLEQNLELTSPARAL